MNLDEPIPYELTDAMTKALDTAITKRTLLLGLMAAAFLDQVGCRPDEVELVERVNGLEVSYYFRKRLPEQQELSNAPNQAALYQQRSYNKEGEDNIEPDPDFQTS